MADSNEPRAQLIEYSKPENQDVSKTVTLLAKTDRLFVAVQGLLHGGENNLHHHKYLDGLWFVLSGRVRFYTTGDRVSSASSDAMKGCSYRMAIRIGSRRSATSPWSSCR